MHRSTNRPRSQLRLLEIFGTCLILLTVFGCSGIATPESVDLFGNHDSNPLGEDSSSTHVVIFTTHDCPIANSYTPTLLRLMDRWHSDRSSSGDLGRSDVVFTLIYLGDDVEAARQHHAQHQFPCTAFFDEDLRWARQVGATHTPECFVMRQGEVHYRGRIDDVYRDYGKRSNQPTRNDLQIAIEQFVNGETIEVPKTDPVGCPIPWRPDQASRRSSRQASHQASQQASQQTPANNGQRTS